MTIKKRISLFCLLFIGGLFFLQCGRSTSHKEAKPVVSVSILPLQYMVDRISGGDFDVYVIVPPGSSPETYEPTPRQMKEVTASKAYFQIGLIDFEQAFAEGIKSNSPSTQMIDLSKRLELLEGACTHEHRHHAGHGHGIDPHTWLSPIRVRSMVSEIESILAEIMPDSADKYRANARGFISSIDSIDTHNRNLFSKIANKNILIYHPFLTYYSDDYGLVQMAVEQDGKEPSANQLKSLINDIRSKNLRTLFYQKWSNRHTVNALAQESGLQTVVLDPLAYDWEANIKEMTAQIKQSFEHGK